MPTGKVLQLKGDLVEICTRSEGQNSTYGWMDYQQISLEFATFWDGSPRGWDVAREGQAGRYPVEPKPPAPLAVSSRSFTQVAWGVMIFSMMSWQILLPAGRLIAASLVL